MLKACQPAVNDPVRTEAHGLCQFDPANIRSAPGVACRRYMASGWTRRLQPTKAGMSHHAKNGTAGQARGARTYFGRYAGPVRMAPVRCLPPRGDVEDATDCTGRSAASGRRGGWNGRPRGRQERLIAGGERLGCGADFNNDGFADLAIGVPGENESAGAVNVLYGTGGGLSGTGGQLFTQVAGNSENGDGFGWELVSIQVLVDPGPVAGSGVLR